MDSRPLGRAGEGLAMDSRPRGRAGEGLAMDSRPLGRAGEGLGFIPIPLSLHSHLLEQAVGVAPTIHHVEDEADVDADATSEALVEPDVA